MKIVLVAPVKNNNSGLAQFPPIGLGYVATALRSAGYKDVRILDCVLERLTLPGFEGYIRVTRPDVVGINSWSLSTREVAQSLRIVKRVNPAIVTVVGGPHPSALGETVMKEYECADYGFRGEAETGAPLLMDLIACKQGMKAHDVPGLMWRDGDSVRSNAQTYVEDLDGIGYPSWDLMRPERYAMPGTLIQKGTACIITTRGCPFPCTFCSAYITAGKKIRKRTAANVMQEIRMLMSEYGISRFVVFDENITLNREHISEFCNAVINEGIKVSFELPNGIRLDTLDLEMLTLMRKAGFSERVAVGIESGSERILQKMKKCLTKDEVRRKVELLNKAGFKPIGYFIIGFPGETREDIEETVRFALELKLYRAGFMPFHPLPGTQSFQELVAAGEIDSEFDWSLLATDTIAYSPVGIPKDELEEIRKRAILRFNLRMRVMWDYLRDYNSFRFLMKKLKSIFLQKKRAPGAGAASDAA